MTETFEDYLIELGYSDMYIQRLLRIKSKLEEQYGCIPDKDRLRADMWHKTKHIRKAYMRFINLYEHWKEVYKDC